MILAQIDRPARDRERDRMLSEASVPSEGGSAATATDRRLGLHVRLCWASPNARPERRKVPFESGGRGAEADRRRHSAIERPGLVVDGDQHAGSVAMRPGSTGVSSAAGRRRASRGPVSIRRARPGRRRAERASIPSSSTSALAARDQPVRAIGDWARCPVRVVVAVARRAVDVHRYGG
jgi:hypothetical protein